MEKIIASLKLEEATAGLSANIYIIFRLRHNCGIIDLNSVRLFIHDLFYQGRTFLFVDRIVKNNVELNNGGISKESLLNEESIYMKNLSGDTKQI